ncbi:MAG: Rid family hydrolase, partial [Chloroflexota bacterium]|nr:Rid family hydrolase [Chloroflexota bacterium]
MSSKQLVQSDNAPAAIGPYSQAVIANGLVYTAGVIPLDPETMEIVGSTVEEQAERVMESLKAL